MHDLMNELAVSVSGTVSTIIDQNRKNFDEKYRHVSLNCPVDLSEWKIPSSLLKANKIRSFLFLSQESRSFYNATKGLGSSFCNTICSNFKSLRMLSLNELELRRVPKCLSKMKQLRYLNLSGNHMTRLPNWVVELENLQTLDLSDCGNLEELPRDLKNMINLRHLMLRGCYRLTHMPCGLGELMCLRTLGRFVLSRRQDKDSAGLGELKKLNELRGRLEIVNLRHGKDISNVANLMNEKRHLASLSLEWSSEGNEVNMDDEDMSLEAPQPHSNLKELFVWFYGGVKFASWLSSLINIVKLHFYYLHRCQYLPPLDHLPCLKLLQLEWLSNLEYVSGEEGWVGSDAYSSTSTLPFFPSLEELILAGCPNLKGWWRPAGRRDQHQSFPRLSTLEIRKCPRLTSMPLYPSLDKELTLENTSFKPFQETMMMKMKNEDDNHMSTSDAELSTCSSLFVLLPCFISKSGGASNVSSSLSPLSKLTSLHISKFDDKEIQGVVLEGISKLTSLQTLEISNFPDLASLLEAIGQLSSLQTFEIRYCSNSTSLPEEIGNLSSLRSLIIGNCDNLTSLPQGIGNLESLHSFRISCCNNFTSFPESIGNLKSLEKLEIVYLPNLTSLPEWIGNLASLRELTVDSCENLTSLPQGIGNLASLRELHVYSCENLTSLPQGIGNLSSLRELIVVCKNLTSLPEGMRRFTSLHTLYLGCSTLLRKRCKKETGEDWPKIAHIPNLDIWAPIENDSEPGAGGKILSAFKTLMHCN